VASAGERVPKLIRAAQTEKIPVTAVIGEKEAEDGTLAVRLPPTCLVLFSRVSQSMMGASRRS
jgi:Anticodon binding domain